MTMESRWFSPRRGISGIEFLFVQCRKSALTARSRQVRHAVAQGAELRRAGAQGFRIEGRRLIAVRAQDGEIAADKAVIAAGAWSKALAAAAGDRVPLETERGYHAVIADPGVAPRYPVMPSDGKMACVMTPRGLRLAGQVELAGLEAVPNWRRAASEPEHNSKASSFGRYV